MIRDTDGIKISYDPEADVLYVTRGEPEYTDYVEYTEDLILRFDPDTKRLVGFTIIDFSQHFAQHKPDINKRRVNHGGERDDFRSDDGGV